MDLPLVTATPTALPAGRLHPPKPPIEVLWARHADEVLAAQRLRYRVFVEEMRARLSPLAGTPVGHDIAAFDAHGEHLLVRTTDTVDSPGRVVGTYRALTPWAARQAGGLYSENEFDLSTLQPLHAHMLELGRSCVDPAFRQGGVILALWAAFGDFMQRNDLRTRWAVPAWARGTAATLPPACGGNCAPATWPSLRSR